MFIIFKNIVTGISLSKPLLFVFEAEGENLLPIPDTIYNINGIQIIRPSFQYNEGAWIGTIETHYTKEDECSEYDIIEEYEEDGWKLT